MSDEIERAEILDWWSAERGRIFVELRERFPLLLLKIDQEIDQMPIKAFVNRSGFVADKINPIVREWIEAEYRRYSAKLETSLKESMAEVEGTALCGKWSYSDMLTAGAATGFSVVPFAALPFVGGLIVTSGLVFTTASLAVVPANMVGVGIGALGLGPSVRGWAVERLRNSVRTKVHEDLTLRVLGDPNQPEIPSLGGTLFKELDSIMAARLGKLT